MILDVFHTTDLFTKNDGGGSEGFSTGGVAFLVVETDAMGSLEGEGVVASHMEVIAAFSPVNYPYFVVCLE